MSEGTDAFEHVEELGLQERLAELEEQNGRLRVLILALAVGVLFAAGLSGFMVFRINDLLIQQAAVEGVVTAQHFVLADAEGTVRGEWTIDESGASTIALSDQGTSERLRLTVRADGAPGISFSDGSLRRRIVLGLLEDETGTLVFADRNGSVRTALGLSGDERANLVFADGNGSTVVALGADPTGAANVLIPAEDGN